jgi:hypothetical protein
LQYHSGFAAATTAVDCQIGACYGTTAIAAGEAVIPMKGRLNMLTFAVQGNLHGLLSIACHAHGDPSSKFVREASCVNSIMSINGTEISHKAALSELRSHVKSSATG